MHQFLNGSDAAYRVLENDAMNACIRFTDQEMPPGCTPGQAAVGFEVHAEAQTAILWVDEGIRYSGNEASVQEWFRTGALVFPSFGELKDWIRRTLKQAFENPQSGGQSQDSGNTPIAERLQNTRQSLNGNLTQSRGSGTNSRAAQPASSDRRSAQELTNMDEVRESISDVDQPCYLDGDVLFTRMRKRVLGQDQALKGVSSALSRHLARRRPARPAVLFAVGPSGVGKTRTAEVAAEELREMNDANSGFQFLRLDMTEYQEAYRVSQLIGSPQGYIGHGEGSQLVDTLRSNPRTIILFDEIEKAHPSILRVLMNAMDAGRLSTASRGSGGHEVDCRHAVFLFTSNVDAKTILDELRNRSAFEDRRVVDEVCRRRLHAAGLAPEIVGRIGTFLVYKSLDPETRASIFALAISEVADEYGLVVTYIEPEVIVDFMRAVQAQPFGARPARYLIDDVLGGEFARVAAHGDRKEVVVCGPPYVCRPVEDGAETNGKTPSEIDGRWRANRQLEPEISLSVDSPVEPGPEGRV